MGRKKLRACTGHVNHVTREFISGCGELIGPGGKEVVRGRVDGDVCRECHTHWVSAERARVDRLVPEGFREKHGLTPAMMYAEDPMLWRCWYMVHMAHHRKQRDSTLLDGMGSGTVGGALMNAAHKLYAEVPTHCPYLEVELDPSYQGDGGKVRPNSPSLDRIDSSRGYHWDNIQVISFLANRIKTNATPEELTTFSRNWLELHDTQNNTYEEGQR